MAHFTASTKFLLLQTLKEILPTQIGVYIYHKLKTTMQNNTIFHIFFFQLQEWASSLLLPFLNSYLQGKD